MEISKNNKYTEIYITKRLTGKTVGLFFYKNGVNSLYNKCVCKKEPYGLYGKNEVVLRGNVLQYVVTNEFDNEIYKVFNNNGQYKRYNINTFRKYYDKII